MSGTRIVVDGLWRCLCPAIDNASLLRVISSPSLPARRRGAMRLLSGRQAPLEGASSFLLPSRCCTVGAARRVHSSAHERVGQVGLYSDGVTASQIAHDKHARIDIDTESDSSKADQLPWVRSLLLARSPYLRELESAPTPAIYAALRQLQYAPAAFDRIHAFVRFLVDERHERPSAALYEALVRANCHTSGSADAVRDVLRVLKQTQIEGTPSLYHGALAVLAVHPDYMLRNAVLQEMKDRWIDLAPEGMQNVALGLLRDGQFERAVDQLEDMTDANNGEAAVPPWLFDVFIYVLGQEGFVDDALRIVNHRLLREEDSVPLNVWYFLLDVCSRQSHYEGLRYVWQRAVRPGRLTPSDAIALDVLNTAARHHDSALSAEVMQMLSARGTKLGMAHFEAMLDCYAGAGTPGLALQALCIMDGAGIVPDEGSTRSIYASLTKTSYTQAERRAAIDGAVASLFDLKAKYGGVPHAAFNVVLEAMLYDGQARLRRQAVTAGDSIEAALDLYRHVRQVCPAGPDRNTFRLLFRGCSDVQHLNFLFCEMRAFSLHPDHSMFNLLVYENAENGSLDLALKYVFDFIDNTGGRGRRAVDGEPDTAEPSPHSRPWLSHRAVSALAQRCVDEEDARLWEVVEASRIRGRPMDAMLRTILQDMPEDKQIAYGVPHAIGLETDLASEMSLDG